MNITATITSETHTSEFDAYSMVVTGAAVLPAHSRKGNIRPDRVVFAFGKNSELRTVTILGPVVKKDGTINTNVRHASATFVNHAVMGDVAVDGMVDVAEIPKALLNAALMVAGKANVEYRP